jgi:hypothetical protein
VTLHQHPPSAEAYAAVMTWVELVKDHFAAEQQALEACVQAWAQDQVGPSTWELQSTKEVAAVT